MNPEMGEAFEVSKMLDKKYFVKAKVKKTAFQTAAERAGDPLTKDIENKWA